MRYFLLLSTLMLIFSGTSVQICQGSERPRLIILADMGNEPDEEQQMVHMLMYSNEFELEGLIAVTGRFLRQGPRPDLFFRLIEGYEKVVDNLRLHAEGWPEPAYLRSKVAGGQEKYGMSDTGPGKTTPGSRLIIKALEKPDPRPLYIVVNAGSNTLAQALIDYEAANGREAMVKIADKLRVFENGAQDDAGAWIVNRYPEIHWIRSNYQTYAYAGPGIDGAANNRGDARQLGPHTWKPYAYSGTGQHQWALEYLKGNNGPLMALWPIRQFQRGGISFLEGGGTIPWLGLVNKGLYDNENPHRGGWSGRFSRERVLNCWSKHSDVKNEEQLSSPFMMFIEDADSWTDPETGEKYSCIFTPVWRWRRAFFNDFAARAKWCNQPYSNANHNPMVVIDGNSGRDFIFRTAKPGGILTFDASMSTDPDMDSLIFNWYIYPEAGTYTGEVSILNSSAAIAELRIPDNSAGSEIHLILEVTDDRPDPYRLFSYRRIIVNVLN